MSRSRLIPTLLVALLALPAAAPAGSWLNGPSSYQQAVQAMAAGRWEEAERLIHSAKAEEGRVAWVMRLLRARAEAAEKSRLSPNLARRNAVAHCYAIHNIYLFLRTEEVADELVDEAGRRAERVYQRWTAEGQPLNESIRWAYAGLLHDLDRAAEAEDYLSRTAEQSVWKWSRGGPPALAARGFDLGFQMLLAYYHTARGDSDAALAYLAAAKSGGDPYVRSWAVESDDFWRLRDDPRFREMFALD